MVPDVVSFACKSARLAGEKEQSASAANCEAQGLKGLAVWRLGQKSRHLS